MNFDKTREQQVSLKTFELDIRKVGELAPESIISFEGFENSRGCRLKVLGAGSSDESVRVQFAKARESFCIPKDTDVVLVHSALKFEMA